MRFLSNAALPIGSSHFLSSVFPPCFDLQNYALELKLCISEAMLILVCDHPQILSPCGITGFLCKMTNAQKSSSPSRLLRFINAYKAHNHADLRAICLESIIEAYFCVFMCEKRHCQVSQTALQYGFTLAPKTGIIHVSQSYYTIIA